MVRAELRLILIGLAASGLLGGCVEGSGDTTGSASPGFLAGSATKPGNREIEAPDVFQVTDSALWDGRPSLGGIWVALAQCDRPRAGGDVESRHRQNRHRRAFSSGNGIIPVQHCKSPPTPQKRWEFSPGSRPRFR